MTCYSGLTAGWVGWANTVRWQIESTWKESPAPFGGRKSPSNIQAIVVWEIWFHVFPHFTDISPNNAVMMYGKTRRSISCPETSDKMESSYLTAELEASIRGIILQWAVCLSMMESGPESLCPSGWGGTPAHRDACSKRPTWHAPGGLDSFLTAPCKGTLESAEEESAISLLSPALILK